MGDFVGAQDLKYWIVDHDCRGDVTKLVTNKGKIAGGRGQLCSSWPSDRLKLILVLRPNLIRDPGFESLFMIWDWFKSFFQDSDPGFANDSQDFAKILRGFVEKWEKILTFGNLKCQVLLKNARFLLKDSQKSQNWKIDSDLPLIRIPKLKIRWRLESLKLGSGLNTIR